MPGRMHPLVRGVTKAVHGTRSLSAISLLHGHPADLKVIYRAPGARRARFLDLFGQDAHREAELRQSF